MLGPIISENDPPFLLHGSFRPTNLEKNLKPCIICIISGVDVYLALVEVMEVRYPETLKYVFVINGRLSVKHN